MVRTVRPVRAGGPSAVRSGLTGPTVPTVLTGRAGAGGANFDLAGTHADVEAARAECRRTVHDVTIIERELRLMPRTLNRRLKRVADEFSFRERTAEMWAGVVEREDALAALYENDSDAIRFGVSRFVVA